MNIQPIKTRIYLEGEDLARFIIYYVPKLKNNSILVVTSKIVALAERRTVQYTTQKAKEKLVRAQSTWAVQTSYGWATLKDGMLVSSAGIDESNGNGKLTFLPQDSYKAADRLRKKLKRIYKVKNLGVIITDSRVIPLRSGVIGMALGYAGLAGLRDYRGKPDIFGRVLKVTRTNIADSLATAANLVMGEGAEQHPLSVIIAAPVQFRERVDKKELKIDVTLDMYGPLFKSFPKSVKDTLK